MISIGTTFNYEITLGDQLPMVKKSGFSHVSLGARTEHSGYLSRSGQREIRRLIQIYDLAICSIHAPFGMGIDISSPKIEIGAQTVAIYRECMDAALVLGASVVIFHPTAYRQFDNLDDRKMAIVDNVNELLNEPGGKEVRLAVENDCMAPANDVLSHSLNEIADTRYGFCYDSSHDNLTAQPLEILNDYGHRLLTTHISDNRGEKDDHILPGEGSFDWNDFCRVFVRTNFHGVFLLEVEMRESAFRSAEGFLAEAFRRGQGLWERCGKV